MDYTKYVDPENAMKVKEEANEMAKEYGMDPPKIVAVDLNHAAVALDVNQAAKEGEANLRQAHEENLKRFDYLKG